MGVQNIIVNNLTQNLGHSSLELLTEEVVIVLFGALTKRTIEIREIANKKPLTQPLITKVPKGKSMIKNTKEFVNLFSN
jgi:hypothetical protein